MAKYKFEDIAINSKLKKKPVEEDKYHYIGLEHLDSGSLEVTRYGSEVAPKGEKLIMKKGDVLFGKRRAYQKKVGIAPFDGIFSAHGMVLRPKENVIDKNFFPLFISSDYFLDAAIKISVGSLSPTINWGDLKELEFELPGLDEQRKLAKILWAAEETKQAYKTLLQKTDDMVKAKFEEMFGKIDKCCLSKFANISAGQSSPHDEEFSEKGIPFIKAGNLEDLKLNKYTELDCNLVDHKTIKNKKLKLHKTGTVLVAKSGMSCLSGHIYVLKSPAYVVSHLACIEHKEDTSLPEFIKTFFDVTGVREFIKDPSYPSIQLSQFSDMEIPNASYIQQKIFATFAQKAEQSKQQLQKSLNSLNTMTKALINENLK